MRRGPPVRTPPPPVKARLLERKLLDRGLRAQETANRKSGYMTTRPASTWSVTSYLDDLRALLANLSNRHDLATQVDTAVTKAVMESLAGDLR